MSKFAQMIPPSQIRTRVPLPRRRIYYRKANSFTCTCTVDPPDPPQYHCPEYHDDQSLSLKDLPSEILVRITSFFDSVVDIRELRCIVRATRDTNAASFGVLAEHKLQVQKDRLTKVMEDYRERYKVELGPEWGEWNEIAGFLGRQYVCEAEDTEGDEWAFKQSQLPCTYARITCHNEGLLLARQRNDRINVYVGPLDNDVELWEIDVANRLSCLGKYYPEPKPPPLCEVHGIKPVYLGSRSQETPQRRVPRPLHNYGGVCKAIAWG